MAAEAVIGQFEAMQCRVVLLLQDGNRTVKILKVSLREQRGPFFLALRAYLLGVLTDRD